MRNKWPSASPSILLICMILSSLASCLPTARINIVESVGIHCKLLGTFESLQCVTGVAAEDSLAKAKQELVAKAGKLGGDTIICCHRDQVKEEIVVSGYDRKTNKLVCVGMGIFVGDVYQCQN